jgi:hypothetical protein
MPGAKLLMDESYRLAHLPLICPGHSKAIDSQPGKFYANGRHPQVLEGPLQWS